MTPLLLSLALAHGAPPQTLQILEQPGSSTRLVGTTFGALVSSDSCTWRWVCDKSIGYSSDERPVWHLARSGAIFAGAYSGLYRSTDQGCTWAVSPTFVDTGVVDLTGEGATVFAVTGKFSADNGIFRSRDDGVTFERAGIAKTTEYFSGVRFAGPRVYVSSWYFEPKMMAIYVSDDGGDHFARRVLTDALPVKGAFTVHAIAPAAADTVYASVFDDLASPQTSHVLKSEDAGKTWATLFSAPGRVSQLSSSADSVWAAVGHRVYRSKAGRPFTALESPTFNACVYQVGGLTLACGSVPFDGFAIGDVSDGGLTTWLEWAQVAGPVSCPAGSAAATTCGAAWPVERYELGLEDAGPPACLSKLDPPEKRTKPGCSCDGMPAMAGLLALLVAGVGGLRRLTSGGRQR